MPPESHGSTACRTTGDVASCAAATGRGVHVLLAGKLTAWDAPGGGEVQMLATARALDAAGVNASWWRPWKQSLLDTDCLHVFGSAPEHLPVVETARRGGVPVVLSPIAWFDLASYWRGARSVAGTSLTSGTATTDFVSPGVLSNSTLFSAPCPLSPVPCRPC